MSYRMHGMENVKFGCLIGTGIMATNYDFAGD
jgi:hypothetical protein